MKHINFIVSQPRFQIKGRKLEFNYLVMILIAVGVITVGFIAHLILSKKVSFYEQKLALLNQENLKIKAEEEAKAKTEVPETVIAGVFWSDWLKKYSAEFPRHMRLDKINGTGKDVKKIVLEAAGETALDASRAKRSLIKTDLCKEVDLKNINQAEEIVTFELECSLL